MGMQIGAFEIGRITDLSFRDLPPIMNFIYQRGNDENSPDYLLYNGRIYDLTTNAHPCASRKTDWVVDNIKAEW
jgi:hypothetical protein